MLEDRQVRKLSEALALYLSSLYYCEEGKDPIRVSPEEKRRILKENLEAVEICYGMENLPNA